MQEYPHPDFKQKVDESKLRLSNDLGKKWANRFKISKSNYLKFMISIMKNKKKYYDLLDANHKSQFTKDYPKMFYAYEIENIVIEQFYHCVPHCIKKLNIAENLREDFHAMGLISLRSAVWNFRTHKIHASLFTFCFNGVFNRILGLRSKHAESLNKSANRAKVHLETDCLQSHHNTSQLSNIASINVNFDSNIEQLECEEIYKKLIEKTDLKEDEIFLLNNYLTRNEGTSNWCQLYIQKYPKQNGKPVTRQGVHVKMAIVKKKLWKTYASMGKASYFDARNKFAV